LPTHVDFLFSQSQEGRKTKRPLFLLSKKPFI
jgi:hypothetical protein